MNSITKNQQSKDSLFKIVEAAFGTKVSLMSYKEHTEGFCNVTYRLDLSDGKSVVLKIAPAPGIEMMSCEIELMRTEVEAMKLAAECGVERVPQIYYYDNRRSICNSEYFIMELLEGKNYAEIKAEMSEKEQAEVDEKIGAWIHCLNEIRGKQFGHFCVEELQGVDWFTTFYDMMHKVIDDGVEKGVDLLIEPQIYLECLQRDKAYFQEVNEPRFIHFDSWDGNVFIENEEVVGLIDWERALWADPLLEDGFRFHNINPHFLRGYGKEKLTEAEQRRCQWYDVYLYLIMMNEGTFRHYETDDHYRWTSSQLKRVWEKL